MLAADSLRALLVLVTVPVRYLSLGRPQPWFAVARR